MDDNILEPCVQSKGDFCCQYQKDLCDCKTGNNTVHLGGGYKPVTITQAVSSSATGSLSLSSATSTSATILPSPIPKPYPEKQNQRWIAGVVIGSIAALALVGVVYIIFKRRKTRPDGSSIISHVQTPVVQSLNKPELPLRGADTHFPAQGYSELPATSSV